MAILVSEFSLFYRPDKYFLKMLFFGKNCGSFENDDGKVVEFFKISAVKFARYVEQIDDGVYRTVGGECNKYSVLPSVFSVLPDDAESYDGGYARHQRSKQPIADCPICNIRSFKSQNGSNISHN